MWLDEVEHCRWIVRECEGMRAMAKKHKDGWYTRQKQKLEQVFQRFPIEIKRLAWKAEGY